MSDLSIPKEIHNQLMTLGKIKVWSWGAHNWQGGTNFLIFNVQGLKFKGKVKISLKGDDTYTIEFFKPLATLAIKAYEGIYFDQQVEIIDNYVENDGRYKD